jgi:hypothetical protein
MPNYANAKIYALRSFQTEDIYIGSTTQPLKARLWKHRNSFKSWKEENFVYITSYEILKFDDCYIELICDFPCENKEQLLKKEGESIREIECINKCIPSGSRCNTDFENGKIYAIRSPQTDDVYIGSTTSTLKKRFQKHMSSFKQWENENYCYVTCFDILKFDDCYIELIENYPCENEEELRKREGTHQLSTTCINKCVAGRTREEWVEIHKEELAEYQANYYQEHKEEHSKNCKEWREKNKEHLKEYNKKRYENPERKAQIKARSKIYYNCDVCEKEVALCKKARHEKSREHLSKSNPDKIKELEKECECGSVYMIVDEDKHLGSKKHYNWLHPEEVAEKKEAKKKARNQQKYFCDVCKKELTTVNKTRHEKSKEHLSNMRGSTAY